MSTATATMEVEAPAPVKQEETPAPTDPPVVMSADENIAEINAIGDGIAKSINYAGMLREYIGHGNRIVKQARKQIASRTKKNAEYVYDKDSWNSLCLLIAERARDSVPITDVRPALYARMALWVDAARAMIPDEKDADGKVTRSVLDLSYFVVANKLVQTLEFNVAGVKGAIKENWLGWVGETVRKLQSSEPPTGKEIDVSYKARQKQIDDARNAHLDPVELARKERIATEALKNKPRKDARAKIVNSISDALEEEHVNPQDVVGLFRDALKAQNLKDDCLAPPVKEVGPNPATMTVEDGVKFVQTMFALRRYPELVAMNKEISRLMRELQNVAAPSKPETQEKSAA